MYDYIHGQSYYRIGMKLESTGLVKTLVIEKTMPFSVVILQYLQQSVRRFDICASPIKGSKCRGRRGGCREEDIKLLVSGVSHYCKESSA